MNKNKMFSRPLEADSSLKSGAILLNIEKSRLVQGYSHLAQNKGE